MKKLMFLSLIGGLFVFFVITSSVASESEQKRLYDAAKKEGEIIYWAPTDADVVAKLAKEGFNKKFPGIKIKHFEISGGGGFERVVMEAEAGKYSADIVDCTITAFPGIVERGLAQKVEWRKIFETIPEGIVFQDGYAVKSHQLTYPIVYNSKLVSPEQVPKSWEDLLDSRWKEQVMVEMRAKVFALMGNLVWGDEKTTDFIQKLKQQNPIFSKGGTTTIQLIAAGEAPVGVGTYLYKIRQWKAKGAPLDWAKVDPLCAGFHVQYLLKNASHPNAGKLWAAWLVSPEGQRLLEEFSFKATTEFGSGTKISEEIQKLGLKIYYEDTAEKARRTETLQKKYTKLLGTIK